VKEIYSHENLARVEIFRVLLEDAGIPALVRNENDVLSAIPGPMFRPALCIMNDEDEPRAVEILKKHLDSALPPATGDWTCAKCGENVPETFDVCWKCEAERE
jgi:hypothetical protein